MNFRFDIQMYCVVSEETDVIQEKLLDQYSFVIQHKDKQHLKIWYNYLCMCLFYIRIGLWRIVI